MHNVSHLFVKRSSTRNINPVARAVSDAKCADDGDRRVGYWNMEFTISLDC